MSRIFRPETGFSNIASLPSSGGIRPVSSLYGEVQQFRASSASQDCPTQAELGRSEFAVLQQKTSEPSASSGCANLRRDGHSGSGVPAEVPVPQAKSRLEQRPLEWQLLRANHAPRSSPSDPWRIRPATRTRLHQCLIDLSDSQPCISCGAIAFHSRNRVRCVELAPDRGSTPAHGQSHPV